MLRFALLSLAFAALLASADPAHAGPPTGWDKLIPSPGRFKVLTQFQSEAVLDKETGLVWQREPSDLLVDWASTQTLCVGSVIGGRRGWRAPTIWELMSLGDPSQNNPALPPGNPFLNVSITTPYWSSSAAPDDATRGLQEGFGIGGGGVILSLKTNTAGRWCVRGPGGQYGGQG
jgi:hypothetical protein